MGTLWHTFDWSQLQASREAFVDKVAPFLEALGANYSDWDFHAQLETKCSEWLHAGRPAKLLMPWDDAEKAREWVIHRLARPGQRPQPTPLHKEFISCSETKEKKRRQREKRWYAVGFFVCAMVAIALSALSIVFLKAKQDAQASQRDALRQLRRAQVGQLMSLVYTTTNSPLERIKVATAAVDLARNSSSHPDLFVMSVLNTVMLDFSALLASMPEPYLSLGLNVSGIAISPDERYLALGYTSGHVVVRYMGSSHAGWLRLGSSTPVTALAFHSPEAGTQGQFLLAWGVPGGVKIWDLRNVSAEYDYLLEDVGVTLSLGGAVNMISSQYAVHSLEFSRTGLSLLALTDAGLLIWEFDTSTDPMANVTPVAVPCPVSDLPYEFRDSSRAVYGTSRTPTIIVQSYGSLMLLGKNASSNGWQYAARLDLRGDTSPTSVVLSPDLRTLAAVVGDSVYVWKASATLQDASNDQALTLDQATDGECPLVMPLPTGWGHTLAFSTSGRYLRAWCPNVVRIWDLHGPQVSDGLSLSQAVTFDGVEIVRALFAPSHDHLVAHWPDSGFYLWDLRKARGDGELVLGLEGQDSPLASVKFTGDGTQLATIDTRASVVTFRDVETGRMVGSVSVNGTGAATNTTGTATNATGAAGNATAGSLLAAGLDFSSKASHYVVSVVEGGLARAWVYQRPHDRDGGSWLHERVSVETARPYARFSDMQFSSTGAFLLALAWDTDGVHRKVLAWRTDALFNASWPVDDQPQSGRQVDPVLDQEIVLIEDDGTARRSVPRLFAVSPDDSFVALSTAVFCQDVNPYCMGEEFQNVFMLNLPRIAGDAQASPLYPSLTLVDSTWPRALAVSPRMDYGRQFLVIALGRGFKRQNIEFWELATGTPQLVGGLRSQVEDVASLAFSADGQYLAMGSRLGVVVYGLACLDNLSGLPYVTLSSRISMSTYEVSFRPHASPPVKILYGNSDSGFHVRTLSTDFMLARLRTLGTSISTYGISEIDSLTGLHDQC
eukprot:jgi/Mesvir1/27539/Mv07297-RA.2